MTHIRVVEDNEATGPLAEVYQAWKDANPGRDEVPGILKCFSARPDSLKALMAFVYPLHFTDGHLSRRTKEMIATYVSGLNQCPY